MTENSPKVDLSLILLGAGPSKKDGVHVALSEYQEDKKIIDWLLDSFSQYSFDLQFVIGAASEELINSYPTINYVTNSNWKNTGASGSLFKANLPLEGRLIVSYSDVLYRRSLVDSLFSSSSDITVVVDTLWKSRYRGRTNAALKECEKVNFANNLITRLSTEIDPNSADAEFIGLVVFQGEALAFLQKLKEKYNQALDQSNLSFLVEEMRLKGFTVNFVDAKGDWAELDDPRDLAQFILGTKAQTLDRLAPVIKKSRILNQYTFSVDSWVNNSKRVVKAIMGAFPNRRIVARSSALTEDGFDSANAGMYDSILNINSSSQEAIMDAVTKVIHSYPDGNLENQVLVQPMLDDVKMSGVIFTRSLSKGAPYYVVNYDDQSGSTESITSGKSENSKMLVIRKDRLESLTSLDRNLVRLCEAAKEIEALINYDSLDIEFAITYNEEIIILQVRPIAVDHSEFKISDQAFYKCINEAEKKFIEHDKKLPFLLGTSALFGLMPDWNPAEIIGVNPGIMAYSLYQEIIMNDIWSQQRAEYGYRDVRPIPLLNSFGGHPYVDVRASINSFIPAGLDDDLAEKYVEYFVEFLKNNPKYHDKLEFEVVPTCYDLNFDKWEKRFTTNGFTSQEIHALKTALIEITNSGINRNGEFFEILEKLDQNIKEIAQEDNPMRRAYLLLEDCKRYGTLPFAHLARSAFVAVALLKSAEDKKIITSDAKNCFLSSIKTISHQFTERIEDLKNGTISMSRFLEEYGHIRPGTYDINMKSYSEAPEHYISPLLKGEDTSNVSNDLEIWEKEKENFLDACLEHGIDSESIEEFMRGAIEGREYAKYLFTRHLSLALEAMLEFASSLGLERSEMANISWNQLFDSSQLMHTSSEIKNSLLHASQIGLEWRKMSSSVELPSLITKTSDFSWFYIPSTQPNFVSTSEVIAEIVEINKLLDNSTDITGKIAVIPNADPGYEWLFGRKIAGLITMFGGANSHMAIRAAEFNLPAAIGLGEKEYLRVAKGRILRLDALNKKIEVIQ